MAHKAIEPRFEQIQKEIEINTTMDQIPKLKQDLAQQATIKRGGKSKKHKKTIHKKNKKTIHKKHKKTIHKKHT